MVDVSDESIQQFMDLANASHGVAQQYLNAYDGDVNEAINAYYAEQADEHASSHEFSSSRQSQPERSPLSGATTSSSPSVGGGGGGAASRNTATTRTNSKFMSFSQMVKANADDEDDDDQNRNTFAGGETSGLEVTDPNDSNALIKDLLEKARRGGQQAMGSSTRDGNGSDQHQQHFTGRGYRLGSVVDVPAQVVENNPTRPSESAARVTREITFWKEGFQVGDGPLYRYNDPANSMYLNELNQGRAPLQLLNVAFGQEVDVNVYKKLNESFKPPKRTLSGFHGTGQKLGSPIPGETATPEPEQKDIETKQPQEQPQPQGDTSVQIRYANGKREVLHCNSTDTVSYLYNHVSQNTQDKTRAFTLNHAFPIAKIENTETTLKDADLANSVVVQRWA